MGQKRIDELPAAANALSTDVVPVVKAADGVTYKLTVAQILSLAASGDLGFYIRFGSVTADIAGTEINFTTIHGAPFSDTNYVFIPWGMKNGGNVDVEIGTTDEGSKEAAAITVYPAADGTTVYYLAVGT